MLDRLGTLHLIKVALREQLSTPDPSFSLGPAHAQGLRIYQVRLWSLQLDPQPSTVIPFPLQLWSCTHATGLSYLSIVVCHAEMQLAGTVPMSQDT